ncbi:MAG: hypothetical protein C0392_03765 [Syntrophus sp. (in: bacteria)]|nr:hypothetical protein [Syntrophus sp. (in: bacteria)]
MTDIFLGITTLAVVVLTIIVVRVMLELRSGMAAMRESAKKTEDSLLPALEELQLTMKSIRKVTDNIGVVTEDVQVFSGSVRQIGDNIRQVSQLVEDVSISSAVSIIGLKAGVKAASAVLLKNIFRTKNTY